MIARVIRKFSNAVYKHPAVHVPDELNGPFGRLKIAVVVDHFTEVCLAAECRIRNVTPANYREVLQDWKPDLLFVESVFHGADGNWRYELAKQPRWLRLSKPKAIFRVVDFAREQGIPTVFWNKDDGAFFDAFIDVASHFDHVFTTDLNCLPLYRARVPQTTTVSTLMMPYQPAYHSFTGFDFSIRSACFTGSYYRKILDTRRAYLDQVFSVAGKAGNPVHVFDRNHDRLSRFFEFRFPKGPGLKIHPRISHRETARLYKSYALSINVNSVTDSETMCSRRLLEILACGGIVMTNSGRCVDKYFRDYCHVVSDGDEIGSLLSRLQSAGPDRADLERAEAGARYVSQNHTWGHRLGEICDVVGI